MASERTNLRLQLLNAGYTPVPCIGKAVKMKAWTEMLIDAAEVARWEEKQKKALNTGLRTARMPTFDADITDEAAAEDIEELVRGFIEERGRILVRIGKAPKRAILFRTDTPFPKIIRNFIAPNTSTKLNCYAMGSRSSRLAFTLSLIGGTAVSRGRFRIASCHTSTTARHSS